MSVATALSPHALPQRVSVHLSEWDRLMPGSEGPSRLLRGLTLGTDSRVRTLAAELGRAGVVTVTELRDGLGIETESFIGRVAIGPLELTIAPKIAWGSWLTLIGYALRLRGLVRTERLGLQVEAAALQDLIVLELVAEARDLLARGLHREYLRERRALAAPRGRIDFGRMARRGGIREPAIPCRFTRRSDDSPLNQALAAGLRSASRVATDANLRSNCRRLVHELELTVTPSPLSAELLRAARGALDRRTERYAPSLRLIELLEQAQSITPSDQPSPARVPLPGFALDMNRLWQQLLSRVLTEWSEGVEVREEYALREVFRSNSDYPLRRSVPTPRPDFAVFGSGRLMTFLDAKYRDLWETSLPREMLYQLALYAMAQGRGAAAMLYPTSAGSAVEQRLDISDPVTGGVRASVALRPVHLKDMEALIAAPRTGHRQEARRAFARRLLGDRPQ
jgi:5-methylcytosine-specific restriction enzyme subunit McrC